MLDIQMTVEIIWDSFELEARPVGICGTVMSVDAPCRLLGE